MDEDSGFQLAQHFRSVQTGDAVLTSRCFLLPHLLSSDIIFLLLLLGTLLLFHSEDDLTGMLMEILSTSYRAGYCSRSGWERNGLNSVNWASRLKLSVPNSWEPSLVSGSAQCPDLMLTPYFSSVRLWQSFQCVFSAPIQLICEMTKLTQELVVKLEQGRDLRQWHSMANWEVSGKTLYGKSEDGKSPSEQDWGKTSRVCLGFIYCLGIYTCIH